MGGPFSRGNRPLLPGAYFNVEAVTQTTIRPTVGATVAVPIVHDWGPGNTATLVTSFADFEAVFGRNSTAGRIAVEGAFLGENVEGWGGAGAVLVYRMLGTGAAKASRALVDTAGTPATAVTVFARYEGTRGNALRVAVIDSPSGSANTDLVIYDGTTEVERFTFADADTQSLVDQINASSAWLTATRQGAGPLALLASTALTGGNDGATLTASHWDTMMAAMGIERFGIFAPFDLTDSAILASLRTWAQGLNAAGKRFRTVTGGGRMVSGGGAESASVAITRAATFADPDFIVLGGFEVEDANKNVRTSSQLAPRYAGILAQRGEVHSATAARLGGITKILSGPSQVDKVNLFKGGVVTVGRDSDPVAPIRFEAAVTTFISKTDANRPYTVFRNPKFVGTIHSIETEVTEYAESYIIGKTPVNDKNRDAVVGEMKARLQRRVDAQIIQPNPTVEIDQDPPPTDNDEFIALRYGVKFGRTAEQVFNTLAVG